MRALFVVFVVISFLFFGSSIYGVKFVNNQYVPADYIVMANQITEAVKAKLTKRYNMRVIGVTGGMADCVNALGLSFQIRGPLTRENLRTILVDCVEEFLTPINANENLRPFLKIHPFPPNRIMITLYVIDNTGKEVYDPEIAVASASSGKIWYNTLDKNAKFGYKQEIEESYETALKIVKVRGVRRNLLTCFIQKCYAWQF